MEYQNDGQFSDQGFSPDDKLKQVLVIVTTTEDLRSAILARNLETSNQLLQTLLRQIDVKMVLDLTLYYVELYLPRFKQIQPDEVWIEAKIAEVREIVAVTSDSHQLPVFPTNKVFYENPLARTYLRAVKSLWSAIRWKSKPSMFTEYASESISKIITLITIDAKDWLPQEYHSLKRENIDRNEIETRLWLDLARRLDTLINRDAESLGDHAFTLVGGQA